MTGVFDAWWLPGVEPGFPTAILDAGSLRCRYPEPGRRLVEDALDALRTAGAELVERPASTVVDAIDGVARRFQEPADPLRAEAEAAVAAATGYSPAMTRLIIDRMAADWRAGPLRALLDAELGGTAALDGFAPAGPGRRSRAYGPRLGFHVFSGNVPGVAVTSIVRALLVKSPVFGKLASGQPVLPVLFARALHQADPDLARAVAITYWPGGSAEAEEPALEAADTIVVYGAEETVRAIRGRAPPDARLLVHGPRYSVGLVAADYATDTRTAEEAARAVATFDQHGCVSPHAIWVEDPAGDRAAAFARTLADALQRIEDELPRGRISPAEASAIQQARGTAELRGHSGSGVHVFRSDDTRWTVVLDPDPTFRPSCLNRFVHVHPIPDLGDVTPLLAPTAAYLQSLALAAPEPRRQHLAHRLARVGATRISTFQRLPWPPPQWHHDGRGPLHELLRWVDLET